MTLSGPVALRGLTFLKHALTSSSVTSTGCEERLRGFRHDLFLFRVEVMLVESGVERVQILRHLGVISSLHWSLLLLVPGDRLDSFPAQPGIVFLEIVLQLVPVTSFLISYPLVDFLLSCL